MAQRQQAFERTDVDISSTGELFVAEVEGAALVSLNIESTADASYALDVSHDANKWFTDEVVYDQNEESSPQDIRDVFRAGDRYLRIRCTDAAATGETADITIQEAR